MHGASANNRSVAESAERLEVVGIDPTRKTILDFGLPILDLIENPKCYIHSVDVPPKGFSTAFTLAEIVVGSG